MFDLTLVASVKKYLNDSNCHRYDREDGPNRRTPARAAEDEIAQSDGSGSFCDVRACLTCRESFYFSHVCHSLTVK